MNETPPNNVDKDEIDLLELLGVLFKYKLFIIIVTVLSAISVYVYSIISIKLPPEKSPLPNLYKPSAIILIQKDQNSGLTSALSTSGLGSLIDLSGVSTGTNYGELAVMVLKGRSLLDKIVEEYNIIERHNISQYLKTNSRNLVLSNSNFNYEQDTNTISISYEDIDPEFAAKIVNRMVELLSNSFSQIGGTRNLSMKNLLESKLTEVSIEMSGLESLIKEFQSKYGVLQIEELAMEQITLVTKLRSEIIQTEVEIETYSDFSTIEDPELKRLKSLRDNLKSQIEEIEEGSSEFAKVIPSKKELPEIAMQYSHLIRDLSVQQKIYEILTQQYELTKLALEGEEPIFQVLEWADPPEIKSGPSRGRMCIVTVVVAFFLSVIGAFVLNAVKNIRKDPEKLNKLKGKTV